MTSGSWESQRHLERIVDEPLKCRQCPNHNLLELWLIGWLMLVENVSLTILTGNPFHKPVKPILLYILEIAFPAASPCFLSLFNFETMTSAG